MLFSPNNRDEPWESAGFWPLCRTRVGYLGHVTHPQGFLKINVFSKMSSCVSSRLFLFAHSLYSKCKTYTYFLLYNLGFKICEKFCNVQGTRAFLQEFTINVLGFGCFYFSYLCAFCSKMFFILPLFTLDNKSLVSCALEYLGSFLYKRMAASSTSLFPRCCAIVRVLSLITSKTVMEGRGTDLDL